MTSARPPLPDAVVERIRRERYAPSVTQGDYLHLIRLRRGLERAFASLDLDDGKPALDLFCGTKPYRDMIPVRPVWGVDIDRHFARADVIARGPLPFADGAFSLVVCTQALHMAEDLERTIEEMYRVLAPRGVVVVTVPSAMRLSHAAERRLTKKDLQWLFRNWESVAIRWLGGPGVGLATYPGHLMSGAARRWPALDVLVPPAARVLNVAGAALEAVTRRWARRWPAALMVIARRWNS